MDSVEFCKLKKNLRNDIFLILSLHSNIKKNK